VRRTLRLAAAAPFICLALAALGSCSKAAAPPAQQTFRTPEDAVRALNTAVEKGAIADVVALFGPDGKALVDSSDPVAARHNGQVFSTAIAEGWRLVDEHGGKSLVIGNEAWPFPVPLVQDANGWRFDTAAGREEVLARRIGRNELAAIQICQTYVAAQRQYAQSGHDGKRAGIYARTVRSDPGKHNGLYWAVAHGAQRSPLGDLMTEAAEDRGVSTPDVRPAPFHGYYFRILTGQGAAAAGGAKSYIVGGEMSGGFALVAWPATYDVTGIMTFLVNQEGVVRQKDLGPDTDAAVRAMTLYDPEASWADAQ